MARGKSLSPSASIKQAAGWFRSVFHPTNGENDSLPGGEKYSTEALKQRATAEENVRSCDQATLTKSALINLIAEQNDIPRKTAIGVFNTLSVPRQHKLDRSERLRKRATVLVVMWFGALPTGSTGFGYGLRIPPVDLWVTHRWRLTRDRRMRHSNEFDF